MVAILELEKKYSGLAVPELGVGAAGHKALFWHLWEYPVATAFHGTQIGAPRKAQPPTGKHKGLAGCSVTGGIPGFSLGTFPGVVSHCEELRE